jgi:hypothetical protein
VRFIVLVVAACAALPGLASAATITVCSSGCKYTRLQSAINAAQPGDTILLRAGQTFVGNFLLPAKSNSSTAYITIRSDAPDASLPNATTRLVPAGRSGANTSSAALARLVGVGGTAKSLPVVRTAAGAHHYKLMFLDIDGAAQQGYETIVAVGTDKTDTPPHHIVFDRVYVHGHPTKGQKRGIALNGGSTDILNSYIADIKAANADSQAIGGWNGKGPYRIINNYVEGSGENIMFGGSRHPGAIRFWQRPDPRRPRRRAPPVRSRRARTISRSWRSRSHRPRKSTPCHPPRLRRPPRPAIRFSSRGAAAAARSNIASITARPRAASRST